MASTSKEDAILLISALLMMCSLCSTECPTLAVLDANDKDFDDGGVFRVTYDLEWSCDLYNDSRAIADLIVQKVNLVLGEDTSSRVRSLSSGSLVAEIFVTSSQDSPQDISAAGLKLQAEVTRGFLSIEYNGNGVPTTGSVKFIYKDGMEAVVDDLCFNYDALDLCNDGECALQDGQPQCVCPDGLTDEFCARMSAEELALVIILGILCFVAVILVSVLVGVVISRKQKRITEKKKGGGILKHDSAFHDLGPPPQGPLPVPPPGEDPFIPSEVSIAVFQPVLHNVTPPEGVDNPGVQVESSHTGKAIVERSAKESGFSDGVVLNGGATVYKITHDQDSGYDWKKL